MSAADLKQPLPLRVLLVDDTPDVRLLVKMLLAERGGIEVVAEATNGREAVDVAAALRPDLIVLDIAMPELDGLSALPMLREVSPESRVVMLSAFPRAGQEAGALAAGAAAYVEKTVGTEELVDELIAGAGLLDVAVQALTAPPAHEGFAADPQSVSAARRFVTGTLAEWELSELADTITLLLSELVTNAIIHADAAPDVTVRLLRDRVHVEVADARTQAVFVQPTGDDETTGRGLALVEALATEWGSASVSGGKVVWFDVQRS